MSRRGAVLLLAMVVAWSFPHVLNEASIDARAATAVPRSQAVVVAASETPAMIGEPVDALHAVVHAGPGGSPEWAEIPLQVDERNDSNDSLFFDAADGLLDANDELVFMASDLGERAPPNAWFIPGGLSRYEVSVTDPATGVTGWAYLHSYAGPQPGDYVSFTPANMSVNTPTYTLGFHDTMVTVLEEVRIHDGADGRDILDRSKFRAFLWRFGIPISLDEEDLEYGLLGYVDGPVRAAVLANTSFILGDGTRTFTTMFFYRDYFNQTAEVHLLHQTSWIRYSNDFSAAAGVMNYTDSLGNTATVDGAWENLGGPPPAWAQLNGTGGTIVTIGNTTAMGGSQSLYYRDDYTSLEDNFVGAENGEYGDVGVRFDNPPQQTSVITGRVHLLPADVGLVAGDYADWDKDPLAVSAWLQEKEMAVDMTYPEGGEVFAGGDVLRIWWNMTAAVPNDQLDIYIYYLLDDGLGLPHEIASGIPGRDNPNTYDWTLPQSDLDRMMLVVLVKEPVGVALDSDAAWPVTVVSTRPVIASVAVTPPRLELPGAVNISAEVVGTTPVAGVWVNLTVGASGNHSMERVPGTDGYYFVSEHADPAAVSFTVWASSTAGVWSSAKGNFSVVDETPPTAVARASPTEIPVGGRVAFDGSSSSDNHRIVSYTWSFEDDGPVTLEGPTAAHAFRRIGAHLVTLRVEDASGNWGTDTLTVTVGPGGENVPLAGACVASLAAFGLVSLGLWLRLRRRVLEEQSRR